MSQKDLRFLEIMDTSAKLQDGDYQLSLPFKRDLRMPNNQQMAEQRAVSLNLKFSRNKTFKEEMTSLHNEQHIDQKGSIFRLVTVLDSDITRVGGCLSRMAMPEVQKHPAILPNERR